MSGLTFSAEEVFGGGAHAALSGSQLTRHIAGLLRADEILADIWVRGEIGNVSRPSSGHLYFALKDETSCISCAMWRGPAGLLPFRLEDGARIIEPVPARARVIVDGVGIGDGAARLDSGVAAEDDL